MGQPTDPGAVVVDSGIAALTDGTLQVAPGVRGVLPKSYGSAMDILKKTHAARSGAEAFVGASMSMAGSGSYQYLRTNSGTGSGFTGSGLIGSNSFTSGSGTPSAKALGIGNSVGSFIGTYNFGPGIGTYNFGTGRWIK